jgi:hypothetical protein
LVGCIVDSSNYVASASNILVGSIVDTSNYVEATSNILVGRIMNVSDTSNILVGRINDTSNYIGIKSNILVGLINNTCNYTGITNNILVGLINNTCNYVRNTRDNLVSFVNSELSTKSQWKYNNNNIYYDTGNVGIGTTNIISKLNIEKSIYSSIIYSSISSSSLLTLENKQTPFFDISPNTGYTDSTTIENNINYKNIIFNAYSTDYPQINNNIYSPYYAENPSGTTLLAWYKFDGDGNDSSPNNKHLSVINNGGNPTYSTDLFQGRRYVNTGTGSFKCIGGFPLNGGSTSFTISCWIKTSSATFPTNPASFSYMHQGALGNTVKDKQFIITIGSTNFYAFDYYSNAIPQDAYSTTPYPAKWSNFINDLGMWVHTVYVVNNNNRKIYRNGIIIQSDTSSSALNTDANTNFYIGSARTSLPSETTMINRNINISDLRIYSNALTQAQVLQLYNNNIINFKIPMPITVNGLLNNVNMGRYMITTSPSNDLTTIMVPLDGQNALTLPSGTSTTVTIKYNMTSGEISGDPPTMIGTTGEYKYLIYTYTTETVASSGQTQYTINIPAGGIVCDILMVGGGGAGDGYVGSGGGGGAVYYGKNVKINEGTYIINVGRGGIPGVSNGFSTNGFGAIIKGGQTGNSGNSVNIASSAGAYLSISFSYNTIDIVTNSTLPSTNIVSYIDSLPILYNGKTGGKNTILVYSSEQGISFQKSYQAGGGGGAGTSAKATYYNSGSAEADGGDGVLVDILGVDLYWGGGGGGAGLDAVSGNGGLGGAGSGNGIELTGTSYEGQKSFYRPSKSKELDAAPHTGGGGGGKYGGTVTTGGSGGSGIIIIKYLSSSSSSDIELISGVTSDNIIDYKIGNYNNIFKITSFKNGINTDNLVIDSNGNVGIGTLPPSYRLEVSECLATTKRGALDINILDKSLGMSSSIIDNTNLSKFSIINICARFNGSIWITGECLFALNSDIRIKEDIQNINDDSALQMILAVEPKTYKYIDKIENGNKKVYGFIAQQVHKVIPEAVSLENAYIPNIMMLADYNNEVIMLPNIPDKVVIKIKDKIKCYDSNNNSVKVKVTEIINDFSFKIKDLTKKYKNNKIFIYGTYVDDFHILSKEYIYTLNVGATQELYRQIKEQDNIIKSREEEINELEKQNKDLNEKYEMLLKEITLIKQRINR